METLINGKATELISVRDRGLQYGDGCFETIRLNNHKLTLLDQHLERLHSSCRTLGLNVDFAALNTELKQFVQSCSSVGVIKIIITRGNGGRGYQVDESLSANRILMYSALPIAYHGKNENRDNNTNSRNNGKTENEIKNTIESEEGVSVGFSTFPLSVNRMLSGLKHLNRLDQVMASRELLPDVDELLCLDPAGNVVEGIKSNLIITVADELISPLLDDAGVNGVMLNYLTQRYATDGKEIRRRHIRIEELWLASELFLCNSVFGVWPVRKLTENATVKTWSVGSWTRQAMSYCDDVFETTS